MIFTDVEYVDMWWDDVVNKRKTHQLKNPCMINGNYLHLFSTENLADINEVRDIYIVTDQQMISELWSKKLN